MRHIRWVVSESVQCSYARAQALNVVSPGSLGRWTCALAKTQDPRAFRTDGFNQFSFRYQFELPASVILRMINVSQQWHSQISSYFSFGIYTCLNTVIGGSQTKLNISSWILILLGDAIAGILAIHICICILIIVDDLIHAWASDMSRFPCIVYLCLGMSIMCVCVCV